MYEKHGLPSIQALRAIAAIAVALAHACHYLEKELGIPNPLPGSEFGSAGVDLFFVISGFVMVYASERFFRREASPAEFFFRRLARIVPCTGSRPASSWRICICTMAACRPCTSHRRW
jgi:peptidoglycan/LPS O-acetylase OafA/YrhL